VTIQQKNRNLTRLEHHGEAIRSLSRLRVLGQGFPALALRVISPVASLPSESDLETRSGDDVRLVEAYKRLRDRLQGFT
jgi:hypothetical protein